MRKFSLLRLHIVACWLLAAILFLSAAPAGAETLRGSRGFVDSLYKNR